MYLKINIWNGDEYESFEIDLLGEVDEMTFSKQSAQIYMDALGDSEQQKLDRCLENINKLRTGFDRYTRTEEKLMKDYQGIPTDKKEN